MSQRLIYKMQMQAWTVAVQDRKDQNAAITAYNAQLIQVLGAEEAQGQLQQPDFSAIPCPPPPDCLLEPKAAPTLPTASRAAAVPTAGDAVTVTTAATASYDHALEAVAGAVISDDDLQKIFDAASGPAHPQHVGVIE